MLLWIGMHYVMSIKRYVLISVISPFHYLIIHYSLILLYIIYLYFIKNKTTPNPKQNPKKQEKTNSKYMDLKSLSNIDSDSNNVDLLINLATSCIFIKFKLLY